MQFPRSMHAEGWHDQMPAQRSLPPMPIVSRDADSLSPSLHSRRFQAVAILVAVTALGASAGLDLIDDPRPLDVQLSAAMHRAGDTLQDWQALLSRGLQVSLRAVADGRDSPRSEPKASSGSTVVASAEPTPAVIGSADADDRDQPVHGLAPRPVPAAPAY